MKHHRHGWTLIEVLVSTTILTILVVLLAEALNTTQRSWLSIRSAADLQQIADTADSLLQRQLRQATLQSRPGYDTSLNQIVLASDLHFVCGPSAELLTGAPGVCSDAIFFQRPAPDGSLQSVLQACGFFVQYGSDDVGRPSFLTSVPSHRRFRLLQFHQPAGNLTLFQPTSVIGEPSRFSQLTARSDLYNWFTQTIADTTTSSSCVSIVAENVVAMIVQTSPSAQRCYDSRHYQWEPSSTDAALSRHQLPTTIEITLVMIDEARWSRLAPEQADSLATELAAFIKGQSWQPEAQQTSLTALQQLLQAHRLTSRVSVITLATASL